MKKNMKIYPASGLPSAGGKIIAEGNP